MTRIALTVLALMSFVLPAAAAEAQADTPKYNVLFVAIDDLRDDVGAFGVDYAKTPHLDAFAKTARSFDRHYVQVPTCGASRLALLSGLYPSQPAHVGNGGVKSAYKDGAGDSLPGLFRKNGYRTLSLGKISHYPGNLTGKGWATGPEEMPGAWDRAWIPDGPWKTPEAIMHGYANGVARKPGKSPPLEAVDGPDELYPDAWVAADAVATLKDLAAKKDQPWFFGVGFFKPHLPFAAPKRWHDLHAGNVPDLPADAGAKPAWPSGWHNSGEFRGNYGHDGKDPANDPEYARRLREAYAGCVSYTDAQFGRVMDALEQNGMLDNTIVVVWGDHGFLLGEHAIWGKHCLFEQAVRSPLMIRHPGMKSPGKVSPAIVETIDIYPTLADLCGLTPPAKLDGKSLRPQLADPAASNDGVAVSYWSGGQRTIRNDRWRLITAPGKGNAGPRLELFDLKSDPQETKNVAADHPDVVKELEAVLEKHPNPAK